MDKKQVGKMLAEANIAVDQIAKMNGVRGVPAKTPIIAMIIQNLHEALLAFDKGVDVAGDLISQEQIGKGLTQMLNDLRDSSQWVKLQEGLLASEANRIIMLQGRIRAAVNALLENS